MNGNAITVKQAYPAYNLLDNSDFRNPIMQAGFNGMHGSQKYIVDRWVCIGDITTEQSSDGIILMSHSVNDRVRQIIESKNLIGKSVTLAVYKTDGSVICGSAVIPSTLSGTSFMWEFQNGVFLILTHSIEGKVFVEIATDTDVSVSIKAVALYEGTYTTETLPLYTQKGYEAELAECQRYYREYGEGLVFYSNGNNELTATFHFERPMREKPSVSLLCTSIPVFPIGRNQFSNEEFSNVTESIFVAGKYGADALIVRGTLSNGLTAGIYRYNTWRPVFALSADL